MAMRVTGRAERDLDRLYRLHRPDVYRSVLRRVGDPDEAEDVTQIAFLDAYRALRRGDEPERPRAWLLTIAHNVARRRYARRAAGPAEVELVAEELAAREEGGPSAGEIRGAFARLGPRQRQALVLREIGGRSYAEIAAALETSLPAVETLLFRARSAFRAALAGGGQETRRRRTLGSVLLWPLPDGAREAVAAAAASLAGRGAAAKLAGGLAATALGTGLVVHSAPTVLAGGEEPAAPAAQPAAQPAAAPAKRVTRERATGEGRRRDGGGTASAHGREGDRRRPAREAPAAEAPKLPAVELPPVELPAVEPATAPVLDLVEESAGDAGDAVAPVTDAAGVEVPPVELPELPDAGPVTVELP
ncbi:MAG TPA: RNA polymerase sigma factor [Gaiellaceae bacterium]|nr:RNA polymerase sigma factor [Gaiellaceae bacterium]